VTGAPGTCAITGLKPGKYTLRASCPGYKLRISTGINTGTPAELDLERNYGSVSGRALKGGAGFKDVLVEADSIGTFYLKKSTLTLADGSYFIGGLPAGSYAVTAVRGSHYSSPLSSVINITASSTTASALTGVDFELFYTQIVTLGLSLQGSYVYSNTGDSYQLLLTAEDSTGRVVNCQSPAWSIVPPEAGTVDGSGLLKATDNFFGRAVVSVLAEGRNASADVTIYYKVVPSANSVEVRGSDGLKLLIPKSVTRDPAMSDDKISVLSSDVSPVRAVSGVYRVASKVYDLKPNGFKFSGDVALSVPLAEKYDDKLLSLGTWDNDKLKWISVGGSASRGIVTAQVAHFSEYAALVGGEGLSLRNLELKPNPFTPKLRPIGFTYSPTSNSGSKVSVSVAICNMIGDRVRTLLDDEFQNVGELQTQSWDGRNDDGELCLNGRYIVDFKINDGTGEKHYIKSVMLVK
jgi:hypothetical protein